MRMEEPREIYISELFVGEVTMVFSEVQGGASWCWDGQNTRGRVKALENIVLDFHAFHATDKHSADKIFAG